MFRELQYLYNRTCLTLSRKRNATLLYNVYLIPFWLYMYFLIIFTTKITSVFLYFILYILYIIHDSAEELKKGLFFFSFHELSSAYYTHVYKIYVHGESFCGLELYMHMCNVCKNVYGYLWFAREFTCEIYENRLSRARVAF